MIFNMVGGSGGSGDELGFTVVGGTSAPSNPSENTIWVNTSAPITSWVFDSENIFLRKSNNLYASTENYGYVNSSGAVVYDGSWKYTPYIELPNSTQKLEIVMSSATGNAPCHAFYDGNKNFIAAFKRMPNTNTYSVPSNAKYIRLSVRYHSSQGACESVTLVADYMEGTDEGKAWFFTGVASTAEFNMLMKNGVQVCPLSAKQCIGGKWVDVVAKSYQGGKWVKWFNPVTAPFYDLNELRENGTGGATVTGREIVFSTTSSASNQQGYACWYSVEKIDLSRYKTLTFQGYRSSFGQVFRVGFRSNNTDIYTWYDDGMVAYTRVDSTTYWETYSIDVSAVNGSYYFFVGFAGETSVGKATMNIKDINLT